MDKQVMEMAKVIRNCSTEMVISAAEALYNAGYRKEVPEDVVVLTREEYESLRQSLAQTTNRECELADRARALLHECDVLKIDLEKARKGTAKEILQVVSKIMFERFGNEPPCNFNCNDEYMFNNCNDYCNKNCEKNVYEKCWKEFFIAKLKANGVEVEE